MNIDPAKVAKLDDADFKALYHAVDIRKERIYPKQYPPEYQAYIFSIMRKVSSRIKSYDDMELFLMRLGTHRSLIVSLRAYGA